MAGKYKYLKTLSDNLHYGTKAQQEALLKWINLAKFKNRKPTPEELTAECLRKRSPLYGLMKTTSKEAAKVYWRQTAQDILRHIDVVRIDVRTKEVLTQPVRAWSPIRVEQYGRIAEENYIPTQRAMNMPQAKRSILERAHGDFLAWMQRYEAYNTFFEEFSSVIDAYNRIRKSEKVA